MPPLTPPPPHPTAAPDGRPRRFSWRRVSELQEMTSPTESLASDDLMADFDKDSDDALEEDEESR